MSLAGSTNHPSAPSLVAEAASLVPPEYWTNDPSYMQLDYYWRGVDKDLKASLQMNYNLLDPHPLLIRDPDFDDALFLLQSRQRDDSETEYYVWNDKEGELRLIKSPKRLKEIYKTMQVTEGYLSGLDLEVVTPSGKMQPRPGRKIKQA